jgi:VWFA-related protein
MTRPTETAEGLAALASVFPGWVDREWAEGHGSRRARWTQVPRAACGCKKVLERISKETGGRMFEVSKKEPVEQIYSQIEEELRNQYSLGYTPDRGNTAGYHKIQVAARQKDFVVQAREGYYGDK